MIGASVVINKLTREPVVVCENQGDADRLAVKLNREYQKRCMDLTEVIVNYSMHKSRRGMIQFYEHAGEDGDKCYSDMTNGFLSRIRKLRRAVGIFGGIDVGKVAVPGLRDPNVGHYGRCVDILPVMYLRCSDNE